MSGQCFLYGFYFPVNSDKRLEENYQDEPTVKEFAKDTYKWFGVNRWQPIPIYTIEPDRDNVRRFRMIVLIYTSNEVCKAVGVLFQLVCPGSNLLLNLLWSSRITSP